MDQIFDRLGNLLRSLFQDEPSFKGHRPSADPDEDAAWDELDEFLKTGKDSSTSGSTHDNHRASTGSGYRGSSAAGRSTVPEVVRRDYANLEVPVDADMETVRKSYHKLVRQYHPDRFAHDPQKLKDATEITQKINQSYQRIRKFRETGST
ncbi:MAG TPA: DnaJ domain-containing protein [Spirochaetia bacterium]|nr:DnaJ domain-containing protein [Spirochaetia bacterium]